MLAAAAVIRNGTPHAQELPPQPVARAEGQIDEAQAEEREHVQKLRRAMAELEARRAEAARRLETREFRQREMARLQGTASALAQRESFLGHDAWWTQRERDALPRDPGDHSAAAQRSALERRLADNRHERDRSSSLLRRETTQRDGLLLRPPR